jgi:hypothetical protein
MENHEGALDPTEADHIFKKHDLICITNEPRNLLRKGLEKCHPVLSLDFLKHKQPITDLERPIEPQTKIYDAAKLDRISYGVVMLVGLGMLIGPIWGLYYETDPQRRLYIITGCIVAFTGLVGSVTVAKPFETLAATAAYAAVLMVYLQNTNNR